MSERNQRQTAPESPWSRPTISSHSPITSDPYCEPDVHGHCLICSDDAQPARVTQLLDDGWTAMAMIDGQEREIDISLIAGVAVGQTLLVHGGVALERIESA